VCTLDLQNNFNWNEFVPFSSDRGKVYYFFSADTVINRRARTPPPLREIRDAEKWASFTLRRVFLVGVRHWD